jgi:hypothetical protein
MALLVWLFEEEITRRCGIQFRYETTWERHENLEPTISAGGRRTMIFKVKSLRLIQDA